MHTFNRLLLPALLTVFACDHADAPLADDDGGGSTTDSLVGQADEGSDTGGDPSTPDRTATDPSAPCEWNGACGGLVEEMTCPGGWAASCGDRFGCVDPDDARAEACFDGGSSTGADGDEPEPSADDPCPSKLSACFELTRTVTPALTCEVFCSEKYGTTCEPFGGAGFVYPKLTDCEADTTGGTRAGSRVIACGEPLPVGQAARCRCATACE